MIEEHDRTYYARRAEAERQSARASKDPNVRKIHASLAKEYERRAMQ